MSDHAVLSPSGASRWLACTPSARLEMDFPNTSGIAAEEGTLAHELCEVLLKHHLNPASNLKEYNKKLKAIKANKLYNTEMLGHANDYVALINDNTHSNSHVFVETKLDMTNYVEDGFGTADAVIITDTFLDFWDLKYGKGVPVFAPDNKQLMIYAIGALNDFGHMFDIKTIRLNIYQPRLNNHSDWEISVEDLIEWAETELKPKAILAFAGEGEFAVGDHCKFCRAKPRCKAIEKFAMEQAEIAFKNPDLLTDQEMIKIFERQSLIVGWYNSVTEYMLAQALGGKQWAGYKLVEGKSNRVYKDPAATEKTLLEKGYKEIYTPKKLLGIGALEKAIGSKPFEELVELFKPAGAPTLVHHSDKRPEMNSVQTAFETPFEEEGMDELM